MPTPDQIRQAVETLSPEAAAAIFYDWSGTWARPNQLPPEGDWRTWLVLAGRGFGKTRTGAEWCRSLVESGACGRIALVAPTAADAREVVVEGESGLLAVCPPWNRPIYEPSKRRVTWPSGAIATTYSADEPERLRGPQHDAAWCDELGAWRYPEAWDMLMLGLRLGDNPRCVVTTTPKPTRIIRALMKDDTCVKTRGTSYENRVNLATQFFDQIVSRYEGTRLGQQEVYAELLEEAEGALWSRALIEQHRQKATDMSMRRVVVAVDPAVTANEQSDETGIVVAGHGDDMRGYVLADLSGRYSPDGWARKALGAYQAHEADRIVGEVNNGGDMIRHTIQTAANGTHFGFKAVHASRGKQARAEPVAALYEQGRVSHIGGFPDLEDQMTNWDPLGNERSPDRVDALVWALTELMVKPVRHGPQIRRA